MTTTIARPLVRVPANTFNQDGLFYELGFVFRPMDGADPIYRAAILPSGWRARGLHHMQPLNIVDEHTRMRVVITYGTLPVLQRDGRIGLQPTARMRLVSLREYLARAIANNEPVIPDDTWATPADIWKLASIEANRANRIAAEFEMRFQETQQKRYEALAKQWTDLANQYAPILLESAA